MTELKAFVGLLLYSAVLKSKHECTTYLFARVGEIFRCGITETRFVILLLCLCFHSSDDRAEKQNNVKLAATSFIFNKFVNSSQQLHELSECVTRDEMLVKFRERSHMISYMPKKPGKYRLVTRPYVMQKMLIFITGIFTAAKAQMGLV